MPRRAGCCRYPTRPTRRIQWEQRRGPTARTVGSKLALMGQTVEVEVDASPQGWRAYVPGLAVVTSYQRKWLTKDVVAGLVLSALLVPQGMAYADLAGLPAVTGLYTSILCLLAYAVFGPSRVLVLGPDSSLGPMIAATILPLMLAGGDPVRAVVGQLPKLLGFSVD